MAEDLDIRALAAIGEAVLFGLRGNRAAVDEVFGLASRRVASNPLQKALTRLCEAAGSDPHWREGHAEEFAQAVRDGDADAALAALVADLHAQKDRG